MSAQLYAVPTEKGKEIAQFELDSSSQSDDNHNRVVPSSIPYEELRFEFSERTPDGFPFKCTSLQGEVNGIFRNPLTQQEVEQALANLDRFTKNYVQRDVPRESLDPVQDAGMRLFAALFAGSIAGTYRAAVDRTASTGGGFRLRFAMRAPELTQLPWEFLYDIDRRDFIALSAQISLIRESVEPATRSYDVAATSKESPLRILIVTEDLMLRTASTVDEEIAPLTKLEEDGLIKLRVLKNASRIDFLSEVESGDYDAIVFMGAPNANEQKSAEIKSRISPTADERIALQDEQVVTTLARQRNLRLFYFNGGQTDLLAQKVSEFVPMSIGMRGMMSGAGRCAFINVLFKNAIDGQWLDAAISHARRAIDLGEPGTREWGMPLCFSSAVDGLRLRTPRQEESPTAAIIETSDAIIIAGVKVKRKPRLVGTKTPRVSDEQKRHLEHLQTLLAVHGQNLITLKEQATSFEALPDFLEKQIRETEEKSDELRRQIEKII
jgi:hypothetical protein